MTDQIILQTKMAKSFSHLSTRVWILVYHIHKPPNSKQQTAKMCRKVFLNFTLCGHDHPRYTPCKNATYVFESGYRLCSVLTTRDDYIDDAFCDPECCYRICNRLWRCCICDIPNRNRHDCYRCSHTICPECYPGKNTSCGLIDRVADESPQRRIQENGPLG